MSEKITADKNEDFSKWYTQVCSPEGAGLADNRYNVKGSIVHLPWSFKILRKIYSLLEDRIEADGHEPVQFPTLIEEESLEREEEHSGFAPEVYWVTEAGDKELDRRLGLRPTGETQFYPMYKKWLRTHTQLPMKYYQSRINVFRYESHARPFLRGREFMFFETHDVFRDQDGVDEQIQTDKAIMESVFWDKLKIPFQFLKRPSWDKFLGAEATYAADTLMPDGRRNQMSSTHDFGTNFAEAYDITYSDENGDTQHPLQTAFGPGIWRIMASVIGIHGDNTGLILPSVIAPVQTVIVPILFGDDDENKAIRQRCEELRDRLEANGVDVKIDDSDKRPGWKYNQWEMKGVPSRVEIGPRDLEKDNCVVATRFGEKTTQDFDDAVGAVQDALDSVDEQIEERAEQYFDDNTVYTEDYDELCETLEDFEGFVKAPFYDIEGDEAASYAEQLKEDTDGGYVCGVKEDTSKVTNKECVVSGKPASHIVYIAKSY